MKRYLKFILLLAILPVFIKAHEPIYCSKEDYQKVLDSVKDVSFAPTVVTSTKEYTDYKINSNKKKDDKIFIDTIIEVDKSEKVEYVEDTRTYRIYGKNGIKEKVTVALKLKPSHVCYPEKLKNIDYYLVYINPYAKNKKCKVYPDFKYCGKNTYLDKDEKEVDKLFVAYAKEQNKSNSISASNQKNNDKKKSSLKHIINLLKKNIVLILAGFILLIVIIITIKYRNKKKFYSILLIFLFPCIISASSSTSWVPAGSWTGTIKPCSKEKQQFEIGRWCDCTRMEVNAANLDGAGNGGSGGKGCGAYGTSGPAHICGTCYGFCFGPGVGFDEDFPRIGIHKGMDFDWEFGSFCNGREYKLPVKLPGYCCYYKGNRNSKYRYYNGPTNSRCKPNMVAIKIDDPTDCQNTTCDDYQGNFASQEQFCNEYADTTYNKDEVKKQCISQRYAVGDRDMRFCNLPIKHTEEHREGCQFKSSSYGSNVFSAKGNKKYSRVFPYKIPSLGKDTAIYLQEKCKYEENVEMKSSGSRFTFINTLAVNNGRNCKYSIYEGKNILRNLMATVFRKSDTMTCEENKYCKAIKYVKNQELNDLLKGNKTSYHAPYIITGKKYGSDKTFSENYNFKTNGETLAVQSKMQKAKDLGKALPIFNKVKMNSKDLNNFERETTAVSAVTLNMQESEYSFPKNVLGPGIKFPAFFSDKDLQEINSSVTFSSAGNNFLCDGVIEKNQEDTCVRLDSGMANNVGINSNSANRGTLIENSEYCEIVVHGHKCESNKYSNVYDLSYEYKAGLRINPRIKPLYYNISNSCVNYSNTNMQKKSVLKGKAKNIYGGVIDEKKNFYHCKITLINRKCPECKGENCGGGPNGKQCKVSVSGNNYTITSPGINFKKDGLYVRKGTPFVEEEYKHNDSPRNLEVWRVHENKIESSKSKYLDYYNENIVKMAEPAVRHPIYFMICENNNCNNPYLCDSHFAERKTDLHDPKEIDESPNVPDCITDLNYTDRKDPDKVMKHCEKDFAKEFGSDGTKEGCLNKCYSPDNANEPQLYRRIDYKDPFPNKRKPGWNWFGREELISKSKLFISSKDQQPLWTIVLKQSDSYNISNINKRSYGYDPYYDLPELSKNPLGKFTSTFLETNLRDAKKSEKKLGD